MTRNRGDTDYNNNYENNNNNKFERKLSRLFEDFLNDVGFTRTHGSKFRGESGKNINWSPAIDIKEVDREYLVVADVPGVRKEDIDIEFHDSVLILSGHLDQQDIYSTPQAQEINVGKDNRQPQQSHQYPQNQYQQQPQQFQQQQYQQQPQYQQSTEPNQYQQPQQQQQQPPQPPPRQQPQQPQPYQQSSEPTEAQQYQQAVDQKYNLTNETQHHQQHQQSQQQSNEYQHVKHRRNNNENNRGERFHIQERPYGHFSRSIQLPSNIKSDDEFMATLENGILKIRIPKNSDKPRRKITIK